jgi:predicted GH43/DUF377 family glycosyl hydrolase
MNRHMRQSPFAFDPQRPVPSVLEQTKWRAGFFEFRNRLRTQYFNPAIVDWRGQRFLIARRRRCQFNPGKNDIVLWSLDAELYPLSETPILFLGAHPLDHFEDPRALVVEDTIWLSYAGFRAPWTLHYPHQMACPLNDRLQTLDVLHLVYRNNGDYIMGNTGCEKNWVWFHHGGAMHFVYSPTPHIVAKLSGDKVGEEWETAGFRWRYGLPRGGTNPVLVNGLYWSFFHSSVEINKDPPRRRYYIGAYAFHPFAPFKVHSFTRKPLLTGSEADPREPSAPLCVFPCGAIYEHDGWLVVFGVNDCASAWIRIPHNDLLKLMI